MISKYYQKDALARYLAFCLALLLAVLSSSQSLGRNVYLNGVDISGAVAQNMKNVDVRIDDRGNVYMSAPQYQVHEEDSYVPLSPLKTADTPEHKAPQALPKMPQSGNKLNDGAAEPASAEVPPDANAAPAPEKAQEPGGPALPTVMQENKGGASPPK